MERYRILLIEDNKHQIAWAKECLKDHKLTIAESEQEFYEIVFQKRRNCVMEDLVMALPFDFAITDMELPIEKGHLTSPHIGKGIFEFLVEDTLEEYKDPAISELKGCALVSNYEHHAAQRKGELLFDLINYTWQYGNNCESIGKPWEPSKVLKVLDLHGSTYSHYSTKDGEIITREEVDKRYGGDHRLASWALAVTEEGGCMYLKPYDKILDCLIQGNLKNK